MTQQPVASLSAQPETQDTSIAADLSQSRHSFSRADAIINETPARLVAGILKDIEAGKLPESLGREGLDALKNLGILEHQPALASYTSAIVRAATIDSQYLSPRNPEFLEATLKEIPALKTRAEIEAAIKVNQDKISAATEEHQSAQDLKLDIGAWALRAVGPVGYVTATVGLFMVNPVVVGAGVLAAGISYLIPKGETPLEPAEIKRKKEAAELRLFAAQDRGVILSALADVATKVEKTYLRTPEGDLFRLSAAGKTIADGITATVTNDISLGDYLTAQSSLPQKTPHELIAILGAQNRGIVISPADIYLLQKSGLIESESSDYRVRTFGNQTRVDPNEVVRAELRTSLASYFAERRSEYPEVTDPAHRIDYQVPRRGAYINNNETRREFRARAIEDLIAFADKSSAEPRRELIIGSAPEDAPTNIRLTASGKELLEQLKARAEKEPDSRSLFNAFDIVTSRGAKTAA